MGRGACEIVTRVDRSGRTCTSLEVAEFPHITSNGSLLLRRAELDSDARGMSGLARALVHGDSGAQSLQRNAGFRLFSPSPGTLNQGSISFQRVYRMNKPFTIGQLASQADVPTSTVRYYERRGLLRCEGRTRSNYRQYGEATLERLRFIRSAQAAGFTLVDIRSLLRFRDGDAAPCRQVQELIAARLDRVRRELAHLREVEQLLQQWSRVCRNAERTGRCGVMDRLGGAEEKESAKSNNRS